MQEVKTVLFGCWMYSKEPFTFSCVKLVLAGTRVLILDTGSVQFADCELEQKYCVVVDSDGMIGTIFEIMLQ